MITERTGTREEACRIAEVLRLEGCPVLDLGCGEAPLTRHMEDVFLVDLRLQKESPQEVIIADIRHPLDLFPGATFGTVYMTDVIEHLRKEEGLSVLRDLEQMVQRIVLFTPLGELWVRPESEDPHDHRSGWTPQEVQDLGFTTWVWPVFHTFASGDVHGAFWAWKDLTGQAPTPEEIARKANVTP